MIQELKSYETLNRDETDKIISDISRIMEQKGYDKDSIIALDREIIERRFQIELGDYFSVSNSLSRINQIFLSSDFIYMVMMRILYEKKENGQIIENITSI